MAAEGVLDRVRDRWLKRETWPPPDVRKHWQTIEGYRRRYRNDRTELISNNPNIAIDPHKVSIYVPVPWPRELCRFSAALLFSEAPSVSNLNAPTEVESIVQVNDLGAFAVRGGVLAASEGRCAIRVIKDPAISSDTPLLTLVPEDQVVWDLRHGSFYAGGMVVITRRPDPDKTEVFRLLEVHTRGAVGRHLYKGDGKNLGKIVPLTELTEFASLAPNERTGLDRPTLIPWENVPGAESDLFGLGPLFEEINEAESLLLDRGRKSIPRAFVDKSLADETGRLQMDGYIFTGGSRMRAPLGATNGSMIDIVDVKLQFKEHVEWVDHVTQLMVTCAGYSPLTWGIQGKTASVQRAVSGYAMKLAQLRTLLNRSPKEHMALQSLGWAIGTATAMMTKNGNVANALPVIELGDGLPNDPLDGAQEVLYLHQAVAASTRTLVETVHPAWPAERVDEEVRLIEEAAAVPPGAGPALGIGSIPRRMRDILNDDDPAAGGGVDPAPGV